jgi:hypothetical protein
MGTTTEQGMRKNRELQPHQRVILRDVGIFLLKLWIDGLKDVVLTVVVVGAAGIDFVRGPRAGGLLFYRAMRWSERFDLWLNLYGVSEEAAQNEEGLFGASRAGSPTFLGKLEELMGGERERREPPRETDPPSDP